MKGYLGQNVGGTPEFGEFRLQSIMEREFTPQNTKLRYPEAEEWYYRNHVFHLQMRYLWIHNPTSRLITVLTDRLPALGGIGIAKKSYHSKFGSHLAGLCALICLEGFLRLLTNGKSEATRNPNRLRDI